MEETIQNDTENISSSVPETQPEQTTIVPYDLSTLSTDIQSARIISPAYSSRRSELAAILQYLYYGIIFENLGYNEIANQLFAIGEQEMHHFQLLAQTLIRLGVDPIYTAFPPQRDAYFTTRFINYITTNKEAMIKSAICDEECAIKQYDSMLSRLTNQTVIDIITHIRDMEYKHIDILKNILKAF